MNLQQILDYRHKCVICQQDMTLACDLDKFADMKLEVTLTNDGLKAHSDLKKDINYLFKYDGTFERKEFHNKPFIINKKCLKCSSQFLAKELYPARAKAIAISYNKNITTINNLRSQGCFYSFAMYTNIHGKYESALLTDNIRFCNNEEFWHLNTDFVKTNQEIASNLYHGRFNQSLVDIFNIKVPAINLSNIKTKEQFLNKFKLYSTFS